MKITIADQPSKKEEKEIRLKLVQYGDAAVELIALDKNGNDTFGANYLLKISEDGITIYSSVNEKIGLPLDEKKHNCVKYHNK